MKIVADAIIVQDGKIFIAKRPEGKTLAHHWEFPGGKQKKDETLPQALHRELKEELNIDAKIGDLFMKSSYNYYFGEIEISFFWATIAPGSTIKSNEHEAIAWVSPNELDEYSFAPADIPVVNKLKFISL